MPASIANILDELVRGRLRSATLAIERFLEKCPTYSKEIYIRPD
jgi:hypothetical protein